MFTYLSQKYRQVITSVKASLGAHTVRQDGDYVSNVSQADFEDFMKGGATPPLTRQAFLKSIKFLVGVNGKKVQISSDLALAPKRYGFKDRRSAQDWINAVELIKG